MENPYIETLSVEHDEVEQTIITDTNGQSVLASERGTQVLVDPSGDRHFRTVTRLVRGEGQRVITDPSATYTCACGSALLTKETVAFCTACQHPACRHHIKNADDGNSVTPLCTACYARGQAKRTMLRLARKTVRFLQWLTNI